MGTWPILNTLRYLGLELAPLVYMQLHNYPANVFIATGQQFAIYDVYRNF